MSGAEFSKLLGALSSWGRWGPEDQPGALHHLTPERVVAADNPSPADHHMTELDPPDARPGSPLTPIATF